MKIIQQKEITILCSTSGHPSPKDLEAFQRGYQKSQQLQSFHAIPLRYLQKARDITGYKKWWRHSVIPRWDHGMCSPSESCPDLPSAWPLWGQLYSGCQIWNRLCRLYICMVQKVRTAGRKTRATNLLATCCTNFRAGVSQECTRKRPLTQDMWHWKPTHHWWAKHPTSKMHVLIARFWITLLAKFWIFQAEQILETPTGLKVRTKWHLPRPKKWLDAVLGWRQGNNKETKRNNNYRTTRDIQRLVILVRIRIAVCLCGRTNT